jgi:hypothetical protein
MRNLTLRGPRDVGIADRARIHAAPRDGPFASGDNLGLRCVGLHLSASADG